MLSRNRWTAMWLILASKTTGQTKKPYFNPSTILGPKWPICPEQTFFSTNHHYFDLPIRPFYCAKLKKNSYLQQVQSYEDVPFLDPNCPFAPNKTFLEKLSVSFSSNSRPLPLCKIFKIFYCRSRIMRMCHFWAQNDPFSQMRFFSENLLISLVPFIHVSLHTKNQSQILIYS